MRTDVIRMYKDIHGWVGIISGLALFIAFYTGAITMFEEPLQQWASRPIAIGVPTPLERTPELIARVATEYPEAARKYDVVLDPGPHSPGRLRWSVGAGEHEDGVSFHANLTDDGLLQVTSAGPSPVAQFIDVLHQQVGLPFEHEVAMPIMGAIALLYAIALVSGVIVLLPTFVADLFALRFGKNLKRMWLDVHNVLGVFSLPFHLVMTLTAVVFAFHDQFYDAQEWAFAGKEPPQIAAPMPKPASDAATTPLPPAQIVTALAEEAPDFRPTTLSYSMNKEARLGLRVMGTSHGEILRGATFGVASVDPYTARIVSRDYLPGQQSAWFAAVTSFFALHFGNFGGAPVRWAYFLLGLAGALLFYTGNLLWIESRRKRERRSSEVEQSRSVRFMANLTVGVSLGCVAGVALTIAAAKWMPASDHVADWHSAIYYTVFIAAVGWSFVRGAALASIELLGLSALCTFLIPASSVLGALGATPWNHGGASAFVDVVAFVGGVGFAAMAWATKRRLSSGPVGSIWTLQFRRGRDRRSADAA